MATDRRSLLKGIAAAAAVAVAPGAARAEGALAAPPDAIGMLYDSTRCIGCKTCVVACREANSLKPQARTLNGGVYDAPEGLNEFTKNVIQLYKDDKQYAYVKKQCMHCLDPGCVNACMLGSLHKEKGGMVVWDAARCVGCRYCQVGCPFGVPQFQYASNNPKIVKCEFCKDRLAAGKQPACTEVCPRNAVIYGKRDDLLREAKRRIAEKPDLYVQKVYGEKDLGGTQVLYVSHIPFEKLGFRFETEQPVATVQHKAQQQIYAPLALYALVGGLMFRSRRKAQAEAAAHGEEKEN